MFRFPASGASAYWEPPVDMLETKEQVVIVVALPGVAEAAMRLSIEGGALLIQGERVLPPELYRAHIHRLELPQGRFERRVPLPAGRYQEVGHKTQDGCVVITLVKQA